MRRLLNATLRLALLLSLPSVAADLGIMPVAVHLDHQRDRATVQVVNQGAEPVILQAETIAWQRLEGVDHDAATGDLIVNPPLFTLQPGQTQIVRLGLRRPIEARHEATYRLVLREVPAPQDSQQGVGGKLRMLVALRVPVYVAPAVVTRDERWQARRDSEGNLVAQVTNAGNVHLKLGMLRLHEGAATPFPLAESPVGALLFPGEVHSVRLRPRAPLSGAPLTLEVLTDRGPQHVALTLVSD